MLVSVNNMKLLDKPTIKNTDIFDDVIAGIDDHLLSTRIAKHKDAIFEEYDKYDFNAAEFKLYSLNSCNRAQYDQIIVGDIKKFEFTNLYTTYMVKNGKPANKHYDKLKNHAPLYKCPYCGIGQVTTLDHFLPKARYPAYSVMVTNLVPSCADCNKGKGSSKVEIGKQTIHPYFDSSQIEKDEWLFSEIIQDTPAKATYHLMPPDIWTEEMKLRLKNHFDDFELAKRFAIEANSEIISISQLLSDFEKPEKREEYLLRIAVSERKHRKNTWKAALYDSLSKSDWFIFDGYRVN